MIEQKKMLEITNHCFESKVGLRLDKWFNLKFFNNLPSDQNVQAIGEIF